MKNLKRQSNFRKIGVKQKNVSDLEIHFKRQNFLRKDSIAVVHIIQLKIVYQLYYYISQL